MVKPLMTAIIRASPKASKMGISLRMRINLKMNKQHRALCLTSVPSGAKTIGYRDYWRLAGKDQRRMTPA